MIRRLVQEQHFRLGCEHHAERQAPPLATGQRAHITLQVSRREPQPHRDHLHAPLQLIRACVLITVHRRGQAVERGSVACRRGFLRVRQLVAQLQQIPEACQQIVHHAACHARFVALAVIAERRAFLQRNGAFIRLELTCDYAQ